MKAAETSRHGKRKNKNEMPIVEQHKQQQEQEYTNKPLFHTIEQNEAFIRRELGGSPDVAIRKFYLGADGQEEVMLVYVDGIVEEDSINRQILEPLQRRTESQYKGGAATDDSLQVEQINILTLKNKLVSISVLEEVEDWAKCFKYLFLCGCIIFTSGTNKAIFAKVSVTAGRSIEEPTTEMTVRGPREGFTESLFVNMSLLRKKIRSPKLWSEAWTIGEVTQTPVSLIYIKGLADETILGTLRERLDSIDIDGILETNYIEELIMDQKWTLFPTVINNERPDTVAASLLEGRVAIMVDGSPFALIMPVSLNSFFQAAEDYYQRYDIATFLRVLRFVSFSIALLMPSLYVAIIGYHQEMIPTQLLLKLAAQREGVPFPAYLEAFLMEFVFEILREAVLRMPIAAGNTVSIVGGLVIGQSIVEAGIVSPAVVIVVSFTAIASFVSPAYNLGIAARLIRFILLLASSTLGFYGISMVIILLLLHLAHLRSIGMPYLKPFAPFFSSDMKDTFVRAPLWKMQKRPQMLAEENSQREDVQMPKEEHSGGQT
ncbi:spore germination protein [Paenibacillus yanchengensis]|uniref:Spore germination protein n=1 Tax=Paenibacillus yanchengensis TaxID=2035833 RepID=A0ABW4YMZ8_9BACL